MSETTEIASLLRSIRRHLSEAHALARAGEVCVEEGWPDRALQVCLDIEPLVHDANCLLHAAFVLKRQRRQDAGPAEVSSE